MQLKILINRALEYVGYRLVRYQTVLDWEQRNQQIVNKQISQQQDISIKKILKDNIRIYWRTIDYQDRKGIDEDVIVCRLCGLTQASGSFRQVSARCAFGGGSLIRYQCPSCDVIFGPFKMFQLTDDELSDEYEAHYRVYEEGDSTDHELRAFYALNPVPSGRYLNFGAGKWSATTARLRNQGWDILSFEPYVSGSSGSEASALSSWNDLNELRFDGIFSNNVLEHLPDPVSTLQNLTAILEPSGQMVHATPCFEYLYEDTRFHLFFFTGKSADVLAQLAKLRMVEQIRDGEYMSIRLARPA